MRKKKKVVDMVLMLPICLALTATEQGSAAFKRLGFTRPASASGSKLLHDGAEMVERKGNETFAGGRLPRT